MKHRRTALDRALESLADPTRRNPYSFEIEGSVWSYKGFMYVDVAERTVRIPKLDIIATFKTSQYITRRAWMALLLFYIGIHARLEAGEDANELRRLQPKLF